MSLYNVLSQMDVKVICLAVLTFGKTYPFWEESDGLFSVAETDEVTSVRFNGSSLTNVTSEVDMPDNSWFHNGRVLTICLFGSESPNTYLNVTQVEISIRFSNIPKVFEGRYYQQRMNKIPNLSFRIEDSFTGTPQISGGDIILNNSDNKFNSLVEYQFDSGRVSFKIGADSEKTGIMIDEDYENSGKFSTVGWKINRDSAQFTLSELKDDLESQIQNSFFTKDEYEYLEDGEENKPKPIAYGKLFGVSPICINTRTGEFMLADHPIWSVDSIRIETETGYEEIKSSFIDNQLGTFTLNSEGYIPYKFILTDEFDPSIIKFNLGMLAGIFPDPASIGEYEVLYYNFSDYPDDPESDPELLRLIVTKKQALPIGGPLSFYHPFSFPGITLQCRKPLDTEIPALEGKLYRVKYNAWDGQRLSVDFHGKTKADGYWMNNASDMVRDILQTYYSLSNSELSLTSFESSKDFLEIGSSSYNSDEKVCMRVPSIYIEKSDSGKSVIQKINQTVGSYLFVSRDGEFEFKVFVPKRGADCRSITEDEVLKFNHDETKCTKQPSILRAEYANRLSEGWSQVATYTKSENKYLRNAKTDVVENYSPCLGSTTETDYFLERISVFDGRPRRKISLMLPYTGFVHFPSDQIVFVHPQKGINDVFEVLECVYDYNALKVSIVLGDRKGWLRGCAFIAGKDSKLPESLSKELGYNSGSLAWQEEQSVAVSTWKTQNVGFWLDDNGYALSGDPTSFCISRYF